MKETGSGKLAMVFNVTVHREDWTSFTVRVPEDSEAVAVWKYPDGAILFLRKNRTLEWQFPDGGSMFFAKWPSQ